MRKGVEGGLTFSILEISCCLDNCTRTRIELWKIVISHESTIEGSGPPRLKYTNLEGYMGAQCYRQMV